MDIVTDCSNRIDEIVALFRLTFTASEGADEGEIVSRLAHDLLTGSPEEHIRFFGMAENGRLVASALFSRLTVSDDDRVVFLLSPMAVVPTHQGRGVGTALLSAALGQLRASGATDAVTYGDPAYYAGVGFRQIDDTTLAPPYPLSQPEGWLGQSLTAAPMPPIAGRPRCAAAFDRPGLW